MFEEHADLIAERITALGGQAMGTAGMAVSGCRILPMPSDVVTGVEFVDVLAEGLAVHDANLYGDIQTANQYEDLDTADLLNEVSREVSKGLWFLEAHRQTQPLSVGDVQAQQLPAQQGRQAVAQQPQQQQPQQQQPQQQQQTSRQ
jgi:starvation-inducible DNA-binding protein